MASTTTTTSNAINAYTYSSAIWLSIQATTLLLTPSLVTALLASDVRRPTDLEIYFSRSLSLALYTLALVTLVLTGSLPLTHTPLSSSPSPSPPPPSSSFPPSSNPQKSQNSTHSLALPTLTLTTTFHAATSFYAYMHYTHNSLVAFGLSMLGSGALAAMGIWCLLFGGEGGRGRGRGTKGRSKRRTVGGLPVDSGEGKEIELETIGGSGRASGWPFPNEEARRVKEEKRRRAAAKREV